MTHKIYAVLFGSLIFAAFIFFMLLSSVRNADAAAPAGYNASVATTSTLAVGPLNNMYAFGVSSSSVPSLEQRYTCAARVISTSGSAIMISFGSQSSTTLSQTVGHWQPASTTVAYDGGLYGCGYMSIRGVNASSTITITETR
jgi:hypothetical protein